MPPNLCVLELDPDQFVLEATDVALIRASEEPTPLPVHGVVTKQAFQFLGDGHYLPVASVCKAWRIAYKMAAADSVTEKFEG